MLELLMIDFTAAHGQTGITEQHCCLRNLQNVKCFGVSGLKNYHHLKSVVEYL